MEVNGVLFFLNSPSSLKPSLHDCVGTIFTCFPFDAALPCFYFLVQLLFVCFFSPFRVPTRRCSPSSFHFVSFLIFIDPNLPSKSRNPRVALVAK